MRKAIKNYLAKLHDNKEKGFSLVELIIVIAIMAILVGVVASQVIPYMEKSRQAKDQQQLSSVCTDMVSAITQTASNSTPVKTFTAELGSITDTTLAQNFYETRNESSLANAYTKVQGKLKSKAATDKGKGDHKIFVSYDDSTGIVTVYMTDNATANGNKVAKLTAESE